MERAGCVYTFRKTCAHITIIEEKESMNLKKEQGRYMRVFGRKKWKEEVISQS